MYQLGIGGIKKNKKNKKNIKLSDGQFLVKAFTFVTRN